MAKPKPEVRFMGAFLMAVGFMIAGLCGTCTLAFGIAAIPESMRAPERGDLLAILPLMLIFGLLPTAVGLLLLRAGFRQYRGPKARGPDAA